LITALPCVVVNRPMFVTWSVDLSARCMTSTFG